MRHTETLVLGGGLAGLSCALHLAERGRDVCVLEKEALPGGTASTEQVDGFLFDRTGHWLHLRDPAMRTLVTRLLEGRLIDVERQARVLSHGVFLPYPFQANTHGLPPEVVRDCVVGFVDALRRSDAGVDPPQDFEEYILQHFGDGIARHFMVPYNTKMWGVPPRELTAAWCSRFVPKPTLTEIVGGAVGCEARGIGYNPRFVYPADGGIGELGRAFGRALGPRLVLSSPVRAIRLADRIVETELGDVGFERLVSTLPLPTLVALLDGAPATVGSAAARLRANAVAYINYGVRGPVNRGYHWVYVPEERFPFYRVGSYSNAVPHLAPPGHGSLYVEVTTPSAAVDFAPLLPKIREGLAECGLLPDLDAIVVEDPKVVPTAYVLFDHACYESRAVVLDWLAASGVRSIGRYGRWTYGSMEDAMLDGRDAAAEIAA